jgi:hypothetical protein
MIPTLRESCRGSCLRYGACLRRMIAILAPRCVPPKKGARQKARARRGGTSGGDGFLSECIVSLANNGFGVIAYCT